MKIQQRIKAILLLGLFLLSPLYAKESKSAEDPIKDEFMAEELLRAEGFLIKDIRESINSLLSTKNKALVDNKVIGKCIRTHLKVNDKDIIDADMVVSKLPLLFDAEFSSTVDKLKIADNLFLYNKKTLKAFKYQPKFENTIKIIVRIKGEDVKDSTKSYWFYKKDRRWVFTAMTCSD